MLKKIFGYMSVFNLNKHRDEYTWMKNYKTKWVWHWHMPNWLNNHLEDISFDNIYMGTPEDSCEKRTCLTFSGSKNIYWVFFRKTPGKWGGRTGDWKWCLKFNKSTNDHTGMG